MLTYSQNMKKVFKFVFNSCKPLFLLRKSFSFDSYKNIHQLLFVFNKEHLLQKAWVAYWPDSSVLKHMILIWDKESFNIDHFFYANIRKSLYSTRIKGLFKSLWIQCKGLLYFFASIRISFSLRIQSLKNNVKMNNECHTYRISTLLHPWTKKCMLLIFTCMTSSWGKISDVCSVIFRVLVSASPPCF